MPRRLTPPVRTPLLLAVAALVLAACSSQKQETPASAASADVHNFMVGSLQASALRDGVVEFPNDNKVFGVGHTPDEVASVLSAGGQPTDKLQLGLNPLLVKSGDRVLLFDTGAGGNFGPSSGHLAAALAAAGVAPASVTDVFISHVHGDHVGGLLNTDNAAAFPNATIHISNPEWEFLKSQSTESAGGLGIQHFSELMMAVTPKVAPFAPGAELIPGVVKAVEIKGHTPGHSGYLVTSGDASLLFMGDAMHHYLVSVQQPDWPNGFDADQKTAAVSRAAVLEQSAASGQRIYAVHFPYPGLGKIEKRDGGFVWVAE
jgi:glyoxylase-like metal-dependent hydrolase (beta-lactamase superfamily II)